MLSAIQVPLRFLLSQLDVIYEMKHAYTNSQGWELSLLDISFLINRNHVKLMQLINTWSFYIHMIVTFFMFPIDLNTYATVTLIYHACLSCISRSSFGNIIITNRCIYFSHSIIDAWFYSKNLYTNERHLNISVDLHANLHFVPDYYINDI